MYQARLDPLAIGSDWNVALELMDADTGDPLDLTDMQFTVTMQPIRGGYMPVVGTTSNGHVTTPDDGVVVINFMAADMRGLSVGDYAVSLKAERDGFTEHLVIGTLPVVDGVNRNGFYL